MWVSGQRESRFAFTHFCAPFLAGVRFGAYREEILSKGEREGALFKTLFASYLLLLLLPKPFGYNGG